MGVREIEKDSKCKTWERKETRPSGREKGADGCHHREGDQGQAESKSQGGTCQSGQAD